MEEDSSKSEKEVKKKAKKKGKEKENTKEKAREKQRKKIKPDEIEFDWVKKYASYAREQCSLKADIIHQFPELLILFDVFSAVINLDGLPKLLVDESNLYTQKNGREFHTNKQETRAFLGIN